MIETCNGCRFKKRCNGRCSKNSTYCNNMRSSKNPQKSVSWFYRTFRGLDKQGIFLKYLQHKEHKEKK